MGFFSGIVDSIGDAIGSVVDNAPSLIGAGIGSYFGGAPGAFLGGSLFGGGDGENSFDDGSMAAILGTNPSLWQQLASYAGPMSSALSALNPLTPIGAGYLSYMGQNSANEQNERLWRTGLSWQEWQNQMNRDFGERMSSTSWQRGVQDMKAAGLNPMLAFSKGGASTPSPVGASSGQSHAMQNALAPSVTSALSANLMDAQVKKIEAETDKTRVDTALSEAYIPKAKQETATSASAEEVNIATRALRSLEYNRMLKEIDLLAESINVRKEDVLIAKENVKNAALTGRNIQANTANTAMNTLLNSLDEQRRRNLQRAEESWWKREVSPYLPDAGRVLNSAEDLRGATRGLRK